MHRQLDVPAAANGEALEILVPGPPPAHLVFVDVGPATNSPILFIHGVGGVRTQWVQQYTAFAGCWRCIAPDLRGHGASETTDGPYTMERLTGDLRQLIAARGVEGPVNVVAHSYGGLIALDLALHHPEQVNRLVLLGLAEYLNFGIFFRLVATLPMPNPLLEVGRQIFLRHRFHASIRVLRTIMREAMLPWPGWSALESITHPILLMAGQYDVVAPSAGVRALARRFPNARYEVIPGAYHKIQLQNSDAVNAHIANFFAESTV